MISEDSYLGELSSNAINGHAHIQSHASDTRESRPAACLMRQRTLENRSATGSSRRG